MGRTAHCWFFRARALYEPADCGHLRGDRMKTDVVNNHASTLRDYVAVARRRKWIILQALVLVPVAALLFSLHQQKRYEASAQVLLSRQNLANTLNGIQDPTVYTQ